MTFNNSSTRALILEHYQTNGLRLLVESTQGFTESQQEVAKNVFRSLSPLIEASLSADQVQKLFTDIEQSATTGGSNRTAIGQSKDVVSKVNKILNDTGKWLQDTTPVKAFDQKFDQLTTLIGKKFPQLGEDTIEIGKWAKNNPGKTAAIIGILTAVAALAGGPIGGAIAGQVLRGSAELFKGEKLSTAVGKSVKAAAVGWIAGKSFEEIGKAIESGVQTVADKMYPGTGSLQMRFAGSHEAGHYADVKVTGTLEDVKAVESAFNTGSSEWEAGNYDAARRAFAKSAKLAAATTTDEYMDMLSMAEVDKPELIQQGQNAVKLIQGLGIAAQGAATGATGMDKTGQPTKESYYCQARPLSEGQVYLLFNRIDVAQHYLTEAGLVDRIKKYAGKVGKNLTTKVTADKLNSAWKKAGSPTESDKLYSFLQQQGVSPDVIAPVYDTMKLEVPGYSKKQAPQQQAQQAPQQQAQQAQQAPQQQAQQAPQQQAQQQRTQSVVDIVQLAAVIRAARPNIINDVKKLLDSDLKLAKPAQAQPAQAQPAQAQPAQAQPAQAQPAVAKSSKV